MNVVASIIRPPGQLIFQRVEIRPETDEWRPGDVGRESVCKTVDMDLILRPSRSNFNPIGNYSIDASPSSKFRLVEGRGSNYEGQVFLHCVVEILYTVPQWGRANPLTFRYCRR